MIPENSEQEQERRLEQREYKSSEDIFNQEEHISLDGNGKPIFNEKNDDDKLDIGSEDEENNYWSLSDNDDDHEEENDDVLT
ncbi:hypothetical protein [Chryseobacterium gambrini]|uniref:hypothetical protein n=1 Tax=Chryseobacterium gambrini TaxID=373672 RepID=UPI0022F1C562|nr:hypothetical protein [Chryseobacterium gambrini]WBV53597.1 hypothetical protein PFY09_04595 [Chryseobacterium gambrini]